MALSYGSKSQSASDGTVTFAITREGMTQSIYAEMDTLLSPPLQELVNNAETEDARAKAEDTLAQARHGWEKMAFAVAQGVIEYLKSNMEIRGLRAAIDESESNRRVDGDTNPDPSASHTHPVDIAVTGPLEVEQTGPTEGLVS